MFADVVAAATQTVSPPFRSILWKSLTVTLILLALAWIGLDWFVLAGLARSPAWIRIPALILTGAGFLFCGAYLIAPISALIVGFYSDDLATLAERELDPRRVGRPLPAGQALWLGARFAGIALVVNALALCLLLVPGVNVVAFLGANAYLLGRVSFEVAALRHLSPADTLALYRRRSVHVFFGGLWIALFLSIPIVNLATPLFAMALMVRVYDRLDSRR